MDAVLLSLLLASALLGHDSFHVREAGQGAATHLPPELLAILAMSDDPEVAMRATRALRESYRSRWRILAERWDARKWPWMDSLPADRREGWPCTIPDPPPDVVPPDWIGYRLATRGWAEACILGGRTIAEVEADLHLMAERCRYWTANSKYPD